MLNGAHVMLYSTDTEADRIFIRDVLGFAGIDAGGVWLSFKLPPAESAVHPTERLVKHECYLMCDDIEQTLADLTTKGVEISRPVSRESWGLLASIKRTRGADLSIYQPHHRTAYDLDS